MPQRPVLSVIALRDSSLGRHALLQERSKAHDDTPYSGYLELPQGRVSEGESVNSFARYKVQSESGLEVVEFLCGGEEDSTRRDQSLTAISHPLCCVSDVSQNHLAICVVALVTGDPVSSRDASNHRWCGMDELAELVLKPRMVFPLNVPMVQELLHRASEFKLAR